MPIALLVMCASAQGATYTVSSPSDQTGVSGSCNPTTRVCTSLRAAIDNVPAGATIQLGATTYTLSFDALRLAQDTTIVGAGMSQTAIRQTKAGAGVIVDLGGTLTLQKLTITGGSRRPVSGDPDSAGGIYDSGTALSLDQVAVTGNTTTGFNGAGGISGGKAVGGIEIGSNGTALTIVSSTLSGNVAIGGHGGSGVNGHSGGDAYGALDDGGSTLVMAATTVSDNSATGGTGGTGNGGSGFAGGFSGQAVGGLALNPHAAAGATITTSTVSTNHSIGGTGGAGTGGSGGGRANTTFAAISTLQSVSISNSLIEANTNQAGKGGSATGGGGGADGGQAEGGGVVADGGVLKLVNTTITGNTASKGSGGTGAHTGSAGSSRGGGVTIENPTLVALVADTISSNTADSEGGNLFLAGPTPVLQDTIVSGGTAPFGSNCDVEAAAVTDTGYNLETTTPSQCGLATSRHDVIGVDPQLAALAANGGPTLTEALAVSSPARGNGGPCIDPTPPGSTPLGIDQRGFPRPNPCDIGAFQSELPKNSVTPKITGTVAFNKKLSCSPGTWSGDGVSRFSYQWTRGGKPVHGATRQTYTVGPKDFATQLGCKVTASGTYGQTSATASIATPKHCNCTPKLSHASQSRKRWTRSQGTTFKFKLDRAARVTLKFTGKHGRSLGTITIKGHRGTNKMRFSGRIAHHKRLGPGRYTVKITAVLPIKGAPVSKPVKLGFTIL